MDLLDLLVDLLIFHRSYKPFVYSSWIESCENWNSVGWAPDWQPAARDWDVEVRDPEPEVQVSQSHCCDGSNRPTRAGGGVPKWWGKDTNPRRPCRSLSFPRVLCFLCLPCNNFEVEQVELFQNARLLCNVFTYFGNSLQSLAWKQRCNLCCLRVTCCSNSCKSFQHTKAGSFQNEVCPSAVLWFRQEFFSSSVNQHCSV